MVFVGHVQVGSTLHFDRWAWSHWTINPFSIFHFITPRIGALSRVYLKEGLSSTYTFVFYGRGQVLIKGIGKNFLFKLFRVYGELFFTRDARRYWEGVSEFRDVSAIHYILLYLLICVDG